MLYKKIKKILITVLSIAIIILSTYGGLSLHNTYINKFRPKNSIESKIDMTEFKIKQVLNTNKLQTLEIQFTVSVNDTEYDKVKYFDKISKLLTTRKLVVEGDYKAIFAYDLSKVQFIKNLDNTYTIILNSNDVEVDVLLVDKAKTKETLSLIGRYYSSQDSARVLNQINELAKNKINTQENKITTVDNTINSLTKLLQNVGVDLNLIKFYKI
jgi:hypothetical protein